MSATEPTTQPTTKPEAPQATPGPRPRRAESAQIAVFAERAALPVTWIALIVVYSITASSTFPTWSNASNILGSQAVLFVLALAALMPSLTGDFDLSLGGIMGLTAMIAGVLNVNDHMAIGLACIIGVVAALAAGLLNGFLVVRCDTNPLIITLGMGSVFTGIIYYLAGSQTIVGVSTSLSKITFSDKLLGIPIEFFYGLALMLIIWYVSTLTPLGLRSLFVGQSRDVARLSGIRVDRIRWGGFVLGGLLAGFAGVLFLGTTGSADPTASGPYLLPAYAAVFLGATTIKPGRFNAFGTAIAVYFLATGVNGLQLLGAQNYVQQLFYGAALVVAVVLSRQLRRSRT
ncbi:MAG: ABC transporter permease [Solirubrobacterales bacterium]|nr:ABC transporter permease [Solirubrobacterales bacterium]MBV9715976.1 ABC transporter permease [Solirubrobacterales bacterium]